MIEYIFKVILPLVTSNLKLLTRRARVVAITGIVLLILLVLITFGHLKGIALSIGPVSPGTTGQQTRWIFPTSLYIILCILDICVIAYFLYRLLCGPKAPASQRERKYPNRLTVHVVLPANRNTYKNSLGDGLLQAAGFLAASDAFRHNISIVPHDHQNNENEAWNILQNILSQEKNNNKPICVIFTMSSICQNVFGRCKEKLAEYPSSVRERLSIVFTVASAPATPHDGDNFYQHFVPGDEEADAIVKYCHISILNYRKSEHYVPRGLLFVMNSQYSKETADIIGDKLQNEIPFERIVLDPHDELTITHKERIRRFVTHTTTNERFAIIVAYDKALLRSIEALNQAGYEGTLIATTTLSVKDWQEYLDSENYWDPHKINVFYTSVRGFDPDDVRTMFAIQLNEWTFDTVIRQNRAPMRFYGADPEVVRGWFDELDKKVYRKIYPNYISAFCFDSVRLFSIMQKHRKRRLSELLDCSPSERNEHSPFMQNALFDSHGKTGVPVEMFSLKSKKVES